MPFVVPSNLIAQAAPSFIPIKTPNAPPVLADRMTKAALCMKWLHSRLTASKLKAAQRVGAVFNDFSTTRRNARATVKGFDYDNMAALGRQYGVHIEQGSGNQSGNVGTLLNALQHKKNCRACITDK